jgi:uncharacterized protein YprB with RNaseH-like and TPR domain
MESRPGLERLLPPARAGTLEELRAVIRRIERRRPPMPAPAPLEDSVGGAVEETEHGPVLVVHREYELAHRHGTEALEQAFASAPALLGVLTRQGPPPGERPRLLFLDTETTGLSGGTGTYAFLVGAAYLDGHRIVLRQLFMRDLAEEPALLSALGRLIAAFDGVVTYNGSAFDLPLLETRFVLGRRRWPDLWHLDLLFPARRVWSARFLDCRLGTLESGVLRHRREDDVPGAMIPALYFDYLRRRRSAALPRVFAHNRDDVLTLVALTAWLARALEGREAADLTGGEHAGLARLWERVDPDRSLDRYRMALACGLAGDDAERVRLRLARWEKRRARWDAACALWEDATRAPAFNAQPWEELAKFYEHRAGDLPAARAVATTALERARRSGASERIVTDLTHRLLRLDRRLRAEPKD